MNDSRCPIASPVASRADLESTCTRAAFWPAVPANDFLPVRTRHQGWQPVGSVPVLAASEVRGVVVSCPVARPLGWSPDTQLLLSPTTPVPTKEKKKTMQLGTATGGGP